MCFVLITTTSKLALRCGKRMITPELCLDICYEIVFNLYIYDHHGCIQCPMLGIRTNGVRMQVVANISEADLFSVTC